MPRPKSSGTHVCLGGPQDGAVYNIPEGASPRAKAWILGSDLAGYEDSGERDGEGRVVIVWRMGEGEP